MAVSSALDVASGYDCLAPYYDRFTAAYAYEPWIAAIEARARGLGLSGRRVLDLACGTGKSSLPWLERGYSVVGCDVSEGMVRQAQAKLPGSRDAFFVADMRNLPPLGEFDLIVCLDDAVNYLLSDDELKDTFAGVAQALAPGGIFAFDVNTLRTFRTSFAELDFRFEPGLWFEWRGEGPADLEPGEIASAAVEISVELEDGSWERHSMRHVQRHHTIDAVYGALAAVGLVPCASLGQHRGARLEDGPDESTHIKIVHFARPAPSRERGWNMQTIQP